MNIHSESFWILTRVLCVVSTLFVVLRVYIRIKLVKFFGVDDGLIILAALASIGNCIVIWTSHSYGLGKPMHTVSRPDVITFYQLLLAEGQLYFISAHAVRASLVVLYRRLSVSPTFLNVCWAYLVCNVAVYFCFVFAVTLLCRPVSAFWDNSVKADCIDPKLVTETNGYFLILLDLTAVTLPMPTVWGLPLPRRQKAWLCLLFGMGFFVCIASSYRLAALTNSPNVTYEVEAVYGWSIVELSLGLIAASFVTFKPLIIHLLPRAFRSRRENSGRAPSPRAATEISRLEGDARKKGAILNFTSGMELLEVAADDVEELVISQDTADDGKEQEGGFGQGPDQITPTDTPAEKSPQRVAEKDYKSVTKVNRKTPTETDEEEKVPAEGI